MISPSTLVEDDHVIFQTTFKQASDGALVNLTGGAVVLRYRFNGGISTAKAATLTDAANGIAQYRMTANELKPGLLEWEWQFTDASSHPYNSDEIFSINVRRKL